MTLTAGAKTVIKYQLAADSTLVLDQSGALDFSGVDVITGFKTGTDKIDLSVFRIGSSVAKVDVTGMNNVMKVSELKQKLTNKKLNNSNALEADKFFTAGHIAKAVKVTDADNSSVDGVYLFVDVSRDGQFDYGKDLVIKLVGTAVSVADGDIVY